jgi:transcriptional regulator with XRE-family HTH domain
MTIGQKIRESRKAKGLRLSDIGAIVGQTPASLSDLENDKLKGGPSAEIIIKIAKALGDQSLLLFALQENPIYKAVIPQIFPDLNNIKNDPSTIFVKLEEELGEALEASKIISRLLCHADPSSNPNFRAIFMANMEQILDVMRGGEVLFLKLIEAGIMTHEDRLELHDRQQKKCEDHGHHRRAEDRV